MSDDREALIARIRSLEAERDRALLDVARQRKRADRAEARLAATRAHARKMAPPPATVRWVEQDAGHFTCTVGAPRTDGEQELLGLPWPQGWLVVGGLQVVDSNRTREVDALVIAPNGLVVIEHKEVRRGGTLRFAVNGPPLLDGAPVAHLTGALAQARLPAQILASTLSEAGIVAGFVAAVLALGGPVDVLDERVGGTWVTPMRHLVSTVMALFEPDTEDNLRVGTVEALLVALGLPLGGLPSLRDCAFHGSDS